MRLVRLFLAFVVLLVLGWSSGASAVPIQWTVAEGGNGHWYEFFYNQMNWHAASSFAQSQSHEGQAGHLATITSLDERNFIVAAGLVPDIPAGNPWIGAYQDTSAPDYAEPGGGWRWVTGEEWGFESWNAGEPNDSPYDENFAALYPHGDWIDLQSFWGHYRVLVEYETNPIPEPSTALLLGLGLVGMAAGRRRIR